MLALMFQPLDLGNVIIIVEYIAINYASDSKNNFQHSY